MTDGRLEERGEQRSAGRLLTRVRDRPGALERVFGLIRRRAFAVERLSLAFTGNGVLELLLRVDTARTPIERIRAELAGLVDVVSVDEPSPASPRPTRELLLVRVPHETSSLPTGLGRIVSDGAGGRVVEITAEPAEVDALVARLRAAEPSLHFVRSGELAIPDEVRP